MSKCGSIYLSAIGTFIVHKLRDFKPHVVWFLGHGTYDGSVRLHFSEKENLGAEEFAELFKKAEHCPEFVVFWACETAKGSVKVRSDPPILWEALSKQGIGGMLGMQSVVSDDAAILMSNQLFRGLAQGLPFEWAIARSRAWFQSVEGERNIIMDWASPVVWIARRPVAQLDWNQSELDNLQLQLLGTVSIGKGQQGVGIDMEPPNNDARNRANNWLNFPITVVRGDKNSTEHKLWFLRILKGVQAVSNKAVLVIIPEEGRYDKQNLQHWAKGFLESLERGRLPEEFFTRIDILSNDAEIGWRYLCLLDDVFLAIVGPPPASENWFWNPLFNRQGSFAILTNKEIPERFREFRPSYVNAGMKVDKIQIEKAMQYNYKLLLTLSLLNLPVRSEIFRELEFGHEADKVFKNWPNLFVKTFGGYVVRADVRDKVLSVADNDALFQARIDCLQLTDRMGHSQKPYLKEFRVDLLCEINDNDEATKELSVLLDFYFKRHEQIPFLRAVKKHFKLRAGLTPWEWLNIASVFLQFGEQKSAKIWLSREPYNPLDIPLKLSLQAEFEKNKGDIDQARELIEQAIKKCSENQVNKQMSEQDRQKAEKDYLEYRHDRARLLQFQERKYSEAVGEYREIINVIENKIPQDTFRHLLAVAYKNLGECVLSLGNKDQEERWREAESHFQTALEHEKSIRLYSHLTPEIHYQLAKLAEKMSQHNKVRRELDDCISSAEESRHGLVATIAKNKLLWIDVKEKDLYWNDIAERWDLLADSLRARLGHSWAARTLINSNVNAARILMKEKQYGIAKEHLQENLNIFRANVNLRRQGDLDRIAMTLAGLHLISDSQQDGKDYWVLLNSEFADAGKHISALDVNSPEKIWKRRL
jgi:tetratricopeptide (TPR) repeat protein